MTTQVIDRVTKIDEFLQAVRDEQKMETAAKDARVRLTGKRNTIAALILELSKEGIVPDHKDIKLAKMESGSTERSAASTASNMVTAFKKCIEFPVEASELVEAGKGWRTITQLGVEPSEEESVRSAIRELLKGFDFATLKQAHTQLIALKQATQAEKATKSHKGKADKENKKPGIVKAA